MSSNCVPCIVFESLVFTDVIVFYRYIANKNFISKTLKTNTWTLKSCITTSINNLTEKKFYQAKMFAETHRVCVDQNDIDIDQWFDSLCWVCEWKQTRLRRRTACKTTQHVVFIYLRASSWVRNESVMPIMLSRLLTSVWHTDPFPLHCLFSYLYIITLTDVCKDV